MQFTRREGNTMQRWLIAAAVVCATRAAYAQAEHYDPIRLDTGLMGTYVRSDARGGFGAVFEPKYLVDDHVAVGARFEAAVMFGGQIDNTGDTSMSIGAVGAAMVKGEYFLGDDAVRPFVGLGVGMFDIGGESISTTQSSAAIDQKAGRYFGVAPQVGIELGRVRLAVTYDAILGADIEVHQSVGNA